MKRKVFRTGNSVVVSLPREALEYLNIHEGTQI
jgi:antitoxin component of MazEF toxin-antitoxin module